MREPPHQLYWECEGHPRPTKRTRFAHGGTSTFFDRKMRPRPRLRFWSTQRPCFRVSSSCTLYEVFGNFAWRSAPPRKRVAQSEKAPALRDREVPPAGGSRRGARLRGNGDRGTCLTEGEALLCLWRRWQRESRKKVYRCAVIGREWAKSVENTPKTRGRKKFFQKLIAI